MATRQWGCVFHLDMLAWAYFGALIPFVEGDLNRSESFSSKTLGGYGVYERHLGWLKLG